MPYAMLTSLLLKYVMVGIKATYECGEWGLLNSEVFVHSLQQSNEEPECGLKSIFFFHHREISKFEVNLQGHLDVLVKTR